MLGRFWEKPAQPDFCFFPAKEYKLKNMKIVAEKIFFGLVLFAVAFGSACEIEPLQNSSANANRNNNINCTVNTNANQQTSVNQQAERTTPDYNSPSLPPFGSNPAANSGNRSSNIIVVSKLVVPVAGIKKQDLRDTFNDARSEGRTHNALDIMAPAGTPVIAATDGKIVRFHESELGGITIYQLATDGRLVLYYAHLQNRAEGITENMDVKKGTVIGYVGDTGNAGAGNYHLHFAMWIVDDPKRYWEGTNINPYQYLR